MSGMLVEVEIFLLFSYQSQ